MNTDIDIEVTQEHVDIAIDPKLALGVARAMQQVAGVAKLYIKHGGPFKPLPMNTKANIAPVKRKPGARQIKRTLKWLKP